MPNLESESIRAGQAREIINHPVFQEARADLEGKLKYLREHVPIHQSEMHTRLIIMEQLMYNFFGYFEMLAQTGRLADLELEKQRAWRDKLKERINLYKSFGRNSI